MVRILVLVLFFVLPACFANALSPRGEGEGGSLVPGATGQPGATGEPDGAASPTLPFFALEPAAYSRKIKSLLTGLTATPDEVLSAASDEGLASLVDTWMATPQYQATLLDFFGLTLQQSQFSMEQLSTQFPYGNHPDGVMTQDLREVMPRTALYFAQNNLPFTLIATTRSFMMTPNVLVLYAVVDAFEPPDGARDYVTYDNPNFMFTQRVNGGASSLADLTNSQSPNYMVFNSPNIASQLSVPLCGCVVARCTDPGNEIIIDNTVFTYSRAGNIYSLMYGSDYIYYTHVPPGNNYCLMPRSGRSYGLPQDNNWRLVTLVEAPTSTAAAQVWDLKKFREDSTVAFRIPRVGFFTTLPFLAQWQTNLNNQARVTINQTLIAGLNKAFDGTDSTTPPDLRGLGDGHAAPNTPCYGCHLTMDPMREYFLNAMTYSYHKQTDPNALALKGSWGQDGVATGGGNLAQLGEQIAQSPRFALGWTLKVCGWLNNGACAESDPEVVRIAQAFAADNFNFNHLVKAVATSPLTTYKAATRSTQTLGSSPTIARRDQFCRMLSSRLGTEDLCALKYRTGATGTRGAIRDLMRGLPGDGYSRASTTLAQATQPSLPHRIGMENICGFVARQYVDNGASTLFSSQNPNVAVDAIVSQLLGLSLDGNADVRSTLMGHYNAAVAQGEAPTDALRSTFVLGCLSPYLTLIGL